MFSYADCAVEVLQFRTYFRWSFMYSAFTRMPVGVIVGDPGLCCCVPRLLIAVDPFVC